MAVKLHQEITRPRNGPPFSRIDGHTWELVFPRPQADRMEYEIEVVRPDGTSAVICDPANPLRAPGPFGEKSVVELPGYRAPSWLSSVAPEGTIAQSHLTSRILRVDLPALVWTPPDRNPAEPLPLLVAHDGLEYDALCRLTHLLAVAVAHGQIPPLRAALLGPVQRNQIYSASAAYTRALAHEVLPRLEEIAPSPQGRSMRVGMGASLGALALLHCHRRYPASFGGLFLQSGSFFRQRFDKQEAGFVRFRRISRFVGQILAAESWPHAIPVTMTCGTAEENLFNNRATAAALRRQGYEVEFHEFRDAHNWVGWRDSLDPHLVDLFVRLWG